MSRNLGALTLLDPSGPAWPVMGVLYLFLINKMDLYQLIQGFPLSTADTKEITFIFH
jgi:hypothetical protein